MTSPPDPPAGRAAFEAFLSASIGPDADGSELTVLSALARLGLDPWSEAAHLAALPRDAAAQALALTLAELPPGNRTLADMADIASRLADRLPRAPEAVSRRGKKRKAAPPGRDPRDDPGHVSGREPPRAAGRLRWLIYAVLAVGYYFLLVQLQEDRQFEPESRAATQQ